MPKNIRPRQQRQSAIPYCNRSPYGWWLTEYLEWFEPVTADRSNPRRRCRVWLNTMIFQAPHREAAYRKAVRMARVGSIRVTSHHGQRLRHRVQGLTLLLPIYEPIEDWTEVLWKEKSWSFARLQAVVKQKHNLAVFQDTPP